MSISYDSHFSSPMPNTPLVDQNVEYVICVTAQANGHRVMTVSPRYDQYKDAWDTEVEVEVYYYNLCHLFVVILSFFSERSTYIPFDFHSSRLGTRQKRCDFSIAIREVSTGCLWITRCSLRRSGCHFKCKY